MKKLVLAMACVLSLGLLASCKQGVQDVNLQNQEKTEAYEAKGTVTFDAARVVTTGTFPSKSWTTTNAPTNTSLSATTAKAFAKVEKTKKFDSRDSNYEEYTITFDVVYDGDTTSANNVLSYSTGKTVTLYKIGDKWYTDDANIDANYTSTTKALVEFAEGSEPTGNFTIKSLGTVAWGTGNWSISNFKFTKAE